MNKNKKQCKNCTHFIWGFSTTRQTSPVRVCALKPKRIMCDTSPKPKQYYYAADPIKSCSSFSNKNETKV